MSAGRAGASNDPWDTLIADLEARGMGDLLDEVLKARRTCEMFEREIRAMNASIGLPRVPLHVLEAAVFMAEHAGDEYTVDELVTSPDLAKRAYRRAARKLHPDIGGNTRMMQRLVEANRILGAHWN